MIQSEWLSMYKANHFLFCAMFLNTNDVHSIRKKKIKWWIKAVDRFRTWPAVQQNSQKKINKTKSIVHPKLSNDRWNVLCREWDWVELLHWLCQLERKKERSQRIDASEKRKRIHQQQQQPWHPQPPYQHNISTLIDKWWAFYIHVSSWLMNIDHYSYTYYESIELIFFLFSDLVEICESILISIYFILFKSIQWISKHIFPSFCLLGNTAHSDNTSIDVCAFISTDHWYAYIHIFIPCESIERFFLSFFSLSLSLSSKANFFFVRYHSVQMNK